MSVIIATRNRPALLVDAIESILAGDAVPAEIVIIDQSDVPAVPPIACPDRGCDIRHVPTSHRGVSRGRNQGGAAARYDLLVFTDDDMRAHHGWLAALVRSLADAGEQDAITGRVLAGREEVSGGFVPALAGSAIPRVYEGRLPKDVVAGGNMAVRRKLFERLGRFDARLGAGSPFPAAEDNDFGFSGLEAGGRVAFVPDAVLHHRAWRSPDRFLPLRYAYDRGKGGFYMKHLNFRDRHMMRRMARDVLICGVRAPRRIARPRLAVGELAYAVGVIHGAVDWLWHAPESQPWRHQSDHGGSAAAIRSRGSIES